MWVVVLLFLVYGCAQQPVPATGPSSIDTAQGILADKIYTVGTGKDRCSVKNCTCRVYPEKISGVSTSEFGENRRLSVYFSEDGDELDARSINQVTKFLSTYASSSISLIGYTDGCGSYDYNKALALRRIVAVKQSASSNNVSRNITTRVEASSGHDPSVRKVDIIAHTKSRLTTLIDKVPADVYLIDASGSMWTGWKKWTDVVNVSFKPGSRVYVSAMRGCYNGKSLNSVAPQAGTEIWYSYWFILENVMRPGETLAIVSDFHANYPLTSREAGVIDSLARSKKIKVVAITP